MNIDALNKVAKVNNDFVYIYEDKIINRKGHEVAMVYKPKDKIFEKGFGVYNLSEFITYLTTFKDVDIVFKDNVIIIKDKTNKSFIKYNPTAEKAVEDVLDKNSKAENMIEYAKKIIETKKYAKFNLSNDQIKKMQRIGNLLKTDKRLSTLTFQKKDDDQENLLLKVACAKNDNESGYVNTFEECDIKGEFSHTIHIDNLIDTDKGTWECYIFDDGSNVDGQEIPNVFMYVKNVEECIEMIITYNQ